MWCGVVWCGVQRKTVLEMKLNTVHINIQEAKVNEANYKNTIKYLKEEELERHKRIDALRRQVQDTDVWTRKVNEQKLLWNDHRIRAEQELSCTSVALTRSPLLFLSLSACLLACLLAAVRCALTFVFVRMCAGGVCVCVKRSHMRWAASKVSWPSSFQR